MSAREVFSRKQWTREGGAVVIRLIRGSAVMAVRWPLFCRSVSIWAMGAMDDWEEGEAGGGSEGGSRRPATMR